MGAASLIFPFLAGDIASPARRPHGHCQFFLQIRRQSGSRAPAMGKDI
jgi:hypothetical protein